MPNLCFGAGGGVGVIFSGGAPTVWPTRWRQELLAPFRLESGASVVVAAAGCGSRSGGNGWVNFFYFERRRSGIFELSCLLLPTLKIYPPRANGLKFG